MCCAASSTAGCCARLAEHQRSAAERARTLLRTRGAVVLADEPGLGKSFVAVAVACHLREEGYEIELIVPAALVNQWRVTLDELGLEACILTHDRLARQPFVAAPSRRRLVIVDEAHAFRNPATQRHRALARRTVAARVLLVTATPFCNSIRDLHALLALAFADDVLGDAGVPSIDAAFEGLRFDTIAAVVTALIIRRDRTVLTADLRFGDLERHVVRYAVTADNGITERLTFPLVGGAPLLRRLLRRRLESSGAALLESVRRQLRFYDRAQESLRGGRLLTKRDYRQAFGREEDAEALQQVLFWDLLAPPAPADENADLASEMLAEVARLRQLQALVAQAPRTKLQQLLDLLEVQREPALIFTGSVATARELFAALRPLRPCGLVTSRDRPAAMGAIDAFGRGALDLLVATDLAAEGLNLQRAGVVVHYDLPWNPVKLDQRNGRAHRIGQMRQSVQAIYFLPRGDDSGVLSTVAAKNRTRRLVLRPERATITPAAGSTPIRPRLTRNAAAVRFLAAAERAGFSLPETLERRHKQGIELLLREMTGEYLDARRIADLLAVLEAEP
jgi:superfamily II DNA or RNA helicase